LRTGDFKMGSVRSNARTFVACLDFKTAPTHPMNFARRILLLAAILGALTVALGAFGAHGLKDVIAKTEGGADYWHTATQYALVHAAALVGLAGFVARENAWKLLRVATWCWFVGAIVFAGTLMAMALGAPKFLGVITPVGGLGLIAGWVLIAAALLRKPAGANGDRPQQQQQNRPSFGNRPQQGRGDNGPRRNDRRRR
jgi:uncharacterized membrane protein YgdD (TMEM256/DUF423 family)